LVVHKFIVALLLKTIAMDSFSNTSF